MERKIILKMQGGMGNQMFQYALGRALQEKVKSKLVLDISDYQYDKKRKFSLDFFNISNNVEIDSSGKYNYLYDQRRNWLIKLAVKLFPNVLFRFGSFWGIYIWEAVSFHPLKLSDKRSTLFVHGLWQSESYFYEVNDIIKKELRVKFSFLSQLCKEFSKQIKNNSVAIHIRRSDYLSKKNKNHVLSMNYYYNAINYIDSVSNSSQFFIFSDDIEWVENNLDLDNRNIVFVDINLFDYEEFYLMSLCKHFIIANSTFSWWASYIGAKADSIIVVPNKWYDDSTDISFLMRDNFVKIGD